MKNEFDDMPVTYIAKATTPATNAQDYKFDKGKPLAGCILEFSKALMRMAEVSTFGVGKYSRGTWKRVEKQRYVDAFMRHLLEMAEVDPEEQMGLNLNAMDEESGIPHRVLALWNLMAINELIEGEEKAKK